MAVVKQTAKLAEVLTALREKHGSDVVDLALWISPKVPDAIMLGRHEVILSKVHPGQVSRLISCLRDLNSTAEEVPATSGDVANKSPDGLTRVVVRWCPAGRHQ